MDLANPYVAIVIGAAGSLLAAGLVRLLGGVGDFLPRRIDTVSIGSSFQPFQARGVGDNYDSVLWIQLRNLGNSPLFVARAAFRNTNNLPVYVNARHSQALRRAYEVKFGRQWKEEAVLIPPGHERETYVPLDRAVADQDAAQGKRGKLVFDYVYNGRSGRHVAHL